MDLYYIANRHQSQRLVAAPVWTVVAQRPAARVLVVARESCTYGTRDTEPASVNQPWCN